MKLKLNKSTQVILIVCLVLMSLTGSAFAMQKLFSDSDGHWAENIINTLAAEGVVSGYPDGLVYPDATITRAEFSALVARNTNNTTTNRNILDVEFTDIKGHWAEKEINHLILTDIIEPNDYGSKFSPDEPITRYEMLRMLVRTLGSDLHEENCKCETAFTDLESLSKTQLEYICIAKKYSIVDGFPDGTLKPFCNATRAEAFAMLLNQNKADKIIKEESADKELVNKEQKQQEDEKNKPIKPSTPSSGSSSSGGSSGSGTDNPTPVFSFDLQQASYVGDAISVTTDSKYVSSVTWSLEKDSVTVAFDKFFDGELGDNGGSIKAKESGNYTLIATAKNSQGKNTIARNSFTAYAVATVQLDAPKSSYTDREVDIDFVSESLGSSAVNWTISKDGTVVNIDDVVDGILGDKGGSVFFNEKGLYTVTASVVDGMGNPSSASAEITIFSKVLLSMDLPNNTYTDKPVCIDINSQNADMLKINWELSRNGTVVIIDEYIEGILEDGENIRFKEKGVYKLTASITDDNGRNYSCSIDITVYPVGFAGFYLPEIFHTDNLVMVDTNFAEIGNSTANWVLKKDGKVVSMAEFMEGTLDNDGGSIKFIKAGKYTLSVSFRDEGERAYSYEQNFQVFAIPVVTYNLPEFAHTDKEIEITTTLVNVGDLEIEWLIDNTYGYQDWNTYVDGNLDNNGGKIYFKRAGVYELVARITDQTGRVFLFESKDKIEIFPVLDFGFTLPNLAYTDTVLDFRTHGNNQVLPVDWTITKDRIAIVFDSAVDGTLNANGGKFRFKEYGTYVLTGTMTDYLGREFSHSEEITVMPFVEFSFSVPNSIHYGADFEVTIDNILHADMYDVNWVLNDKNGVVTFDGSLGNSGGTMAIGQLGTFTLTATITDKEGRLFDHSENIEVLNTAPSKPVVSAESTRTTKDNNFLVKISAIATDPDNDEITFEWDGRTADDYYPVGIHEIRARAKDIAGTYSEWESITFEVTNHAPTVTVTAVPTRTTKNGNFLVNISAIANDEDNDKTTLEWDGRMADDYYSVGSHIIKVRAKDIANTYSEWESITFDIMNHAPTVTVTAVPTRTTKNSNFLVNISATANDTDGDTTTLEWDGRTADDYYSVGSYTVRVRAKDIADTYSAWQAVTFEVVNHTPMVSMTAVPTRTAKNGDFFVKTSVAATDADGDKTTLEWSGKASDDYYAIGTHTIKVRAKDEAGVYSEWVSQTFTINNSAPTTPVITRTPNGNCVAPGSTVTISASSTDPDGDTVTYIWEGRDSERQSYPLGKNVVRVKSVDATGAESPWAAIVFFVADATNGGGMTLTGPESTINENGLDGATITKYTFTVPPVSGHSGQDYGRVRGYNIKTNQWDQLSYGTTTNGITFDNTIEAGIYSKLEFYYYTNHNCSATRS